MSEDRCIKWEREYANVETGRLARGVVKTLGSWRRGHSHSRKARPPRGWVYRSSNWFMDRHGRARGEMLHPLGRSRVCPPSVHTARSCKRKMDRSMVIELGTDGSPLGPWKCVEYDGE